MPCEPLLRLVPFRALFLALGAHSLAACSGPPPRLANPARPLDERRALEVIAEAFREEREHPTPGGDIFLSAQHRLHIDVAAEGKRFGVAYVTAGERAEIEPVVGMRDPNKGDALQLATGIGPDSDARVCLLYDNEYLYDDQVGEAHEKSTTTAELKLRRDARDFLVYAHREHFK
ncbi:MAG TPA: hypothetical protein VG937_36135 [Polyangiaceae bacterium]|nr:hypothetical protein [Polyangiaceae bacterium]